MVLVVCGAESLRGAPQTPQSTVIVMGGLVGSLLRQTWLCDGFLMNPGGFVLS